MNEKKAHNENILLGALGTFIFSLLGGVLFFIVYQLGFIAGICGFVTVWLAMLGYGIFSGRKNSIKGIIISIIISIAVIFFAEYFGVAYAAYKELDGLLTFNQILDIMPEVFEDSEAAGEFGTDLLISYALCAIASFTFIKKAISENKAEKAKSKGEPVNPAIQNSDLTANAAEASVQDSSDGISE